MQRYLERPKRLLTRIWSDRNGASTAEYAVILAVVSGALVMSVIVLSLSISDGVDDATGVIESTASNGNCDNSGLGAGFGGGAGGGGGQGTGSGDGNTCP